MKTYFIELCPNPNDDIYHHGIGGMKWGKRNGPPYPLDFKKLSAEEREQAKANSINRGDVITANRNRDYYSYNELQSVINRFDMNVKITKLEKDITPSTMKKVEKICDTLGKLSDNAEKVIKGYNTLAKVSNTFANTKLPMIKNGNPNGKQ